MLRLPFNIFKTQKSLTEEDTKKAIKILNADGVCSTAMGTLQGGPFLVAFALALGASNYQIGLLATIGFVAQFMQMPGLYLTKVLKKRRAITFLAAGTSRLLWLVIIFIPLLFKNRGVDFLIILLFCSALLGAIPGPSWNSMIRDIVPEKIMGQVFSKRMILGTTIALILTPAAGYFVDWWKEISPQPLFAYSFLFSLGLIFGIIGVLAVGQLPEPTMQASEESNIFELLLIPFKDCNFRFILAFIAAWNFAMNLAGPFFMIYMLTRIKISLFLVTVLIVSSQISNLLFLKLWGKFTDKFSNKSVLAICGPLTLITILIWPFTTMPERYFLTIPLLFVIHVLGGIAVAGINIASGNIALKLSPKGNAHVYMTVFGLAGAATGAIAPILGGTIADFFAVRELSIAVQWLDPLRKVSVSALNFRALDFLFVIAVTVGFFAMHLLTKVKEEGEVEEKEVFDQLINEIAGPIKGISSVSGLRRIAQMPMSLFLKRKEEEGEQNAV